MPDIKKVCSSMFKIEDEGDLIKQCIKDPENKSLSEEVLEQVLYKCGDIEPLEVRRECAAHYGLSFKKSDEQAAINHEKYLKQAAIDHEKYLKNVCGDMYEKKTQQDLIKQCVEDNKSIESEKLKEIKEECGDKRPPNVARGCAAGYGMKFPKGVQVGKEEPNIIVVDSKPKAEFDACHTKCFEKYDPSKELELAVKELNECKKGCKGPLPPQFVPPEKIKGGKVKTVVAIRLTKRFVDVANKWFQMYTKHEDSEIFGKQDVGLHLVDVREDINDDAARCSMLDKAGDGIFGIAYTEKHRKNQEKILYWTNEGFLGVPEARVKTIWRNLSVFKDNCKDITFSLGDKDVMPGFMSCDYDKAMILFIAATFGLEALPVEAVRRLDNIELLNIVIEFFKPYLYPCEYFGEPCCSSEDEPVLIEK